MGRLADGHSWVLLLPEAPVHQSPYCFSSKSLAERAFSELLFCKKMTVANGVIGRLRQPFLSLPSVRECATLLLHTPQHPFPIQIAVAKILQWLNADVHSNEPKRLEMEQRSLGDSTENLVQRLKTVGSYFFALPGTASGKHSGTTASIVSLGPNAFQVCRQGFEAPQVLAKKNNRLQRNVRSGTGLENTVLVPVRNSLLTQSLAVFVCVEPFARSMSC